MSYEDLVADPSKSNIICMLNSDAEKLVELFPWWPELHGWWRKNLAYNTAYCVADSGQNLAAEALLMFKQRDGGEGSKGLEKTVGVEGEVEDGENEDELEDEEGNVGVNGDHIMDESENLAIPTSGMI
ncbi:hypothetical protein PAXRUDRAFT_834917, partial [Paxillus rubicundulus Ve08.2h10]